MKSKELKIRLRHESWEKLQRISVKTRKPAARIARMWVEEQLWSGYEQLLTKIMREEDDGS